MGWRLTLLGVSAGVLLELFNLSLLRRRILRRSVGAVTWQVASLEDSELYSSIAKVSVKPGFLDVLFIHTCSLFRSLLLDQIVFHDESRAGRNRYMPDRPASEEAVRYVCSLLVLHYTLTWPLFVTGLVLEAGNLGERVKECLNN